MPPQAASLLSSSRCSGIRRVRGGRVGVLRSTTLPISPLNAFAPRVPLVAKPASANLFQLRQHPYVVQAATMVNSGGGEQKPVPAVVGALLTPWQQPNPSVKRDWPLVAPSGVCGILSFSGFGHPALRPAPYLIR